MASVSYELEAGANDSAHQRGPRQTIRRSVGALRKPLRSLRTKILLFVLSATLTTSVAVMAVSVHVVEEFVQNEVEGKLHSFLIETAERITDWYRARFDEIQVFADAKTLYQNLRPKASHRTPIDEYLRNVTHNLTDMDVLFLLDEAGRIAGWAGQELALPPALLLTVTGVQNTVLGDRLTLPQGDLQILSTPVRDPTGAIVGSLHAVLNTQNLAPMVRSQDLSASGRLVLVDDHNKTIVSSAGDSEDTNQPPRAFSAVPHSAGRLQKYQTASGDWAVGASLVIPPTRHTLILEESYAQIFGPVTEALYKALFINLGVVALFGVLAFLIARSIVRPIDTLVDDVQRIAQGERNVVSRAPDEGEVGMLAHAINTMMAKLESRTQRLEQLSKTDGLTGLYNQRVFKTALQDEAADMETAEKPLSLVLVDIDHFKTWNDHHGHDHGDEVLRVVARVMANTIRGSDLLARYGGDEFAILARNTSLAGAQVLAEKLCAEIARHGLQLNDHRTPPLSVSVGVAQYDGDLAKFFRDADQALYSAKRCGRNCVRAA